AERQRLRVVECRRTAGGVAVVADRQVARQRRKAGLIVHLVDQPHADMPFPGTPVADDHARRFLATVLQRLQSEKRRPRRAVHPEDTENSTLLVDRVDHGSALREVTGGRRLLRANGKVLSHHTPILLGLNVPVLSGAVSKPRLDRLRWMSGVPGSGVPTGAQ